MAKALAIGKFLFLARSVRYPGWIPASRIAERNVACFELKGVIEGCGREAYPTFFHLRENSKVFPEQEKLLLPVCSFGAPKFCMNFPFGEYVCNISDYVSANVQAQFIKDKEIMKIIKFSIIKLVTCSSSITSKVTNLSHRFL